MPRQCQGAARKRPQGTCSLRGSINPELGGFGLTFMFRLEVRVEGEEEEEGTDLPCPCIHPLLESSMQLAKDPIDAV